MSMIEEAREAAVEKTLVQSQYHARKLTTAFEKL